MGYGGSFNGPLPLPSDQDGFSSPKFTVRPTTRGNRQSQPCGGEVLEDIRFTMHAGCAALIKSVTGRSAQEGF